MARSLRIDLPGGFYHVTARGNARETIFREDDDRVQFVQLLGALTGRFGLKVHAWVLMGNHYHLLLETSSGGLSRAMQWLNLSYSSWVNRRHRRSGHLFQGRFSAVVVEFEEWGLALSRYLHLNPVRTTRWGLGKSARAQARIGSVGPAKRLTAEQWRLRTTAVQRYRWGSFRAYAGLEAAPAWLTTNAVLRLLGGRWRERHQNYRDYVEEAIRENAGVSPWMELKASLVLGSEEFVGRLAEAIQGNRREQPALRRLQKRPALQEIIAAAEKWRGESWELFRDRHGDWLRDGVLLLGRERAGATLRELGAAAGGLDYSSVSVAVSRFAKRLTKDRTVRRDFDKLAQQMQNEKIP